MADFVEEIGHLDFGSSLWTNFKLLQLFGMILMRHSTKAIKNPSAGSIGGHRSDFKKHASLEASITNKLMQGSIEVQAFQSPFPETDTESKS